MVAKPDAKSKKGKPPYAPARKGRGFMQTGGLVSKRIRTVSERRGFAETRLLTHWAEIVGASIAAIAEPVKVSYARDGIGATLTILSSGARAPELQMLLPQLQEKVNACYGYNAISRIRITQTAERGFAEPAATFEHKKPNKNLSEPRREELKSSLKPIDDDGLRAALEKLGQNVLTR